MADRVTVDIDIDEAKLHKQVSPFLRRVTNRVAEDIRDEAKRTAPIRTGKLRASIRASRATERTPYLFRANVTAHDRIAVYVHEGTRPHFIRARRGHDLRLPRGMFRSSVRHPGATPRPFLVTAARRVVARRAATR